MIGPLWIYMSYLRIVFEEVKQGTYIMVKRERM